MEQANEERGEVEVKLEGVSYVLRPSYEAQVAIERQTGKSIEALCAAAGSTSLSIDDAAVVVTECIRAQGRAIGDSAMQAFNAKSVGECIVDAGKLPVVKRIELLLYLAVMGGYTAKGEARALPTKTPMEAAPAEAGQDIAAA